MFIISAVARIARAVAPGLPHHVTQRGNRRLQTFFSDDDYAIYLRLMQDWFTYFQVDIWGYCLMPNHIHLIAVPPDEEALTRAISEVHHRYTRHVNFQQGWRGHLWQGRFASYVMDEHYLLACIRYIEMNPVKAKLVLHPAEWRWSSARAHIDRRQDDTVNAAALSDLVEGDWTQFLAEEPPDTAVSLLRKHERTGRPLGSPGFVDRLETLLSRSLQPKRRGRPPLPKN